MNVEGNAVQPVTVLNITSEQSATRLARLSKDLTGEYLFMVWDIWKEGL